MPPPPCFKNSKIYVWITHHPKWFCLGIVFAILGMLYLFNPLPGIFNWLLVYQTPFESADAVLIGMSGGILEAAVDLYKKGIVKKILITKNVPEKYRGVEAPISTYHLIRLDLQAAGVPDADILSVERDPTNLLDAQRLLRDCIRKNQIHSYICFPALYHSRFQKWLHDDTFPQGDVKAIIIPVTGKEVFRKQLTGIHNVLIRMAYWFWVYRPQMAHDFS